jgi:hypothetical protein
VLSVDCHSACYIVSSSQRRLVFSGRLAVLPFNLGTFE